MFVADGAGVAAGGGALVVILALVSALGRGAILAARAHRREQVAERRHQETLAAIRGRRAPAVPAQTAAQRLAQHRTATPDPQDALPEAAIAQAAKLVIESRYATVPFLQRRMRVEIGTATRLLAELERRGVVGPQRGAGSREVLVARDAG